MLLPFCYLLLRVFSISWPCTHAYMHRFIRVRCAYIYSFCIASHIVTMDHECVKAAVCWLPLFYHILNFDFDLIFDYVSNVCTVCMYLVKMFDRNQCCIYTPSCHICCTHWLAHIIVIHKYIIIILQIKNRFRLHNSFQWISKIAYRFVYECKSVAVSSYVRMRLTFCIDTY